MKRGELDEPLDIKKSRESKQQLKDGIILQPDLKAENEVNLQKLTDGFQTGGDNIKRNDSVKSVLSIAPEDCKLETKIINKSVINEKLGDYEEEKEIENKKKSPVDRSNSNYIC